MKIQYVILLFVCYSKLASALPARITARSVDIKPVVQHIHEDSYIPRDDASIHARASGSGCSPLTLTQVQSLPGWSKIQQYASDTYGDGGVNIVLNPPEYLDRPALVCLQDSVVSIQMQGTPSCTSTTSQLSGGLTGTSGSQSIELKQGFSNTGTWSVTQESSLGIAASVSVGVSIPAIVDISASVTTTATFTNTLSNSFSTTVDTETKQKILWNVADGQQCAGSLTTKTCNVQGTGSTAYVASGYVWFNYDSSRAPKSDPNGGKHYKYAIDIASVLTNINDRSSGLSFSGGMQIKSDSYSNGNCRNATTNSAPAAANKALTR